MKEHRNKIDIIDENIRNLFIERMQIIKSIAEYKKANNLPILDEKRENEIIARNKASINDPDLVDYYEELSRKFMEISRRYQERIIKG